MKDEQTSRYWLDAVLDQVQARTTGDVTICSGITPSGPYHVGHGREILTAEAIRRGLIERGQQAHHIHNVDDFDALRKRYPYLPEKYEQEAGKPVYLIPAPDGTSASYADQYFSEYAAAADKLGIPMEIWRSHEEYQKGVFADVIHTALERRNDIARILADISGREVADDWQPIQILDAQTQSLRTATFLSYDMESRLVHYTSQDGTEQVADPKLGQIKLDWRVDWPARWHMLGVVVEGFGKEHATKGGSYDTGAAIQREIFGTEPPIPVPFNPINLKGDNQKMSSSLGNLVSIGDALKIIPPDVLRYFVFKSLPQKVLEFDPGVGMYNLVDEFAATENAVQAGENADFAAAWKVSVLDPNQATVSRVPFSHLVTIYQTARRDVPAALELLKRTHPDAVSSEADVLEREFGYIGRWLDSTYAPDSVKFSIQESFEALDLDCTPEQVSYLKRLEEILASSDWDGDSLQAAIFETAKALEFGPRDAFKLLYQLFIAQDAGPKLGPFLATLERDFVLTRLKEGVK